ncbi:MAG TPA: YicC/YloC family endoribonuclease [Xanthobacteraceae bacterium]|nr:YicC/YloC family endoribonuclease [Xanthobacteraceae bacterium]
MALSSMTGFARTDGVTGAYVWGWEVKSVNGKSLELRLRLPPGWEAVEIAVRGAAKVLQRGNVFANLTVRREGLAPVVRVNQPVLNAILSTMRELGERIAAQPATLDGILAIKGVIEVFDQDEDPEEHAAAERAILAGFEAALRALSDMRRHEGEALGRILRQRLDEIEALAKRAEQAPGRQPAAIKARLVEQIALLIDTPGRFDADRLHQEALLLASKADIREELDRIAAHVGQARKLLSVGGAVGRRLDFLAQEFNREVNTLCSKSNDVELTTIGLELKNVVEQFREQVQNLE